MSGEFHLISGVDCSGKSSLLTVLEGSGSFTVVEAANVPGVREFRSDHAGALIDADLVDARESLFLEVNATQQEEIKPIVDSGRNVATTAGRLVTRVSHDTMRQMINEPSRGVDVVNEWLDSGEPLPDHLVLLHVPDDIIQERMRGRVLSGLANEQPWGFNSPQFLRLYQQAWYNIFDRLSEVTDIALAACNTSVMGADMIASCLGMT